MDALTGPDRQRMLRQLWRMAEYLEAWKNLPMHIRPGITMVRHTWANRYVPVLVG